MSIASLVEIKRNRKVAAVSPGDTVKVRTKVIEAGKEHAQTYQGVVIKMRRGGVGASFTVRRVTSGVGVENTFPINSPLLESVEVVRHGKVRRAKLYYLRGRSGRMSRIKEKRGKAGEAIVAEPTPEATAEAAAPETPEAAESAPAE